MKTMGLLLTLRWKEKGKEEKVKGLTRASRSSYLKRIEAT